MHRLKLVRQTEATECGLACLAMVASSYGSDVNLAGLRARFGTSSRGMTLRTLIKIANQLELASRPVRLELDVLQHLRLPAIAHWDLDHFVVIQKVTAKTVVVYDPARGIRDYSLSEVSDRFTGVALELEPWSDRRAIREKVDRLRLGELARQVPNFWTAITQLSGLALILQLINLVPPLLIQNVVDKVLPAADLGLLNVLALAFLTAGLLAVFSDALSTWVALHFGHSVAFSTVRRIFAHLLRLPLGWFDARGTGDILAKIQSQRPIQDLFVTTLPLMLSDALVVATTAVVICFYSLTLSAVVFACLLVLALLNLLFYPALLKREEETIAAAIDEQGYLVETLRSIRVIRNFGGEAERQSAWQNHFYRVVNAGLRSGKLRVYLRASQGAINTVQIVLVVYLASRLILADGTFTAGMLFAFLFFRQNLADKSNSLIQRIVTTRLARLHLERLSDILMAAQEPLLEVAAAHDASIRGSIKMSQVWMKYGPTDQPTIRGVDLEITAGEFVAVVGPTGGGKTSLIKLMAGLATPYAGEILVDGLPLEQFGRATWRRHVGIVMQDDSLMSGTIADNISFFDPDTDMERVKLAASLAAVAPDIERMPMRYWSWVGDMGSALSGGQRQRLLLARALYQNPRALFLDEGTANLDTDTERQIVETIADLKMTRIVITHRPALVARADRVLSVHAGTVSEVPGDGETLAARMAGETLVERVNRLVKLPASDPHGAPREAGGA